MIFFHEVLYYKVMRITHGEVVHSAVETEYAIEMHWGEYI